MAGQPRIFYVQPAQMNDPATLAAFVRGDTLQGRSGILGGLGAVACTGSGVSG